MKIKITTVLILINVIFFVVAMFLSSGQQKEIKRLEENLNRLDGQMAKIERKFIGFREVMERISRHISPKEARREFKQILRRGIEQGGIIPRGTPEYDRWSILYTSFKELEEELNLKRERFLFNRFGFIPKYPKPLSILTYSFLHINPFSFLFNLLFLFVIGHVLESRWGGFFLAIIYLGGGIFGSLIHWITNPLNDIPVVGGVSSIAILMGVFMVCYYREKVRLFSLLLPFSSLFLFVCWLVQLIFQPIFEPLEVVRGQGILVPLTTFTLGIIVGLARTGKLKRSSPIQASPYRRMIAHANELFGLARFDKAKEIFERVIEKEPDNIEAHEGLARIYSYWNQEKEAISEYNRVIGIALKTAGNALEKYESFTKAYPGALLEPENEYGLARILEEKGRLNEAMATYRKICLSYPEHRLAPHALYALGKIYLRLNKKEEALDSFEKVIRLYPEIEWIDQVKRDIEKAKALGH